MRRRTVLMGAGGLGSILVIGRATRGAQGIDVRIVETNDPVQAGDFLEVTAEATNTTNADQRPEFGFFVGDDRLITRITTIPAGETTTLEFSHLTYPAARNATVPVSIRTESTTVDHAAEVTGIAALDDTQTRPASELSVPPETAVLFEVEWDALGEYGGRTHWYLDDQFAGWSQGPWNAAYYQAAGRDHLTQAFTAAGSYDVAASIRGDDENRTARWTVDVTPDAAPGPSIESASPESGPLELSSTETVDLEATVSAPAGLDRAVWWVAHADVVLGVDDLSGTEDTTSLSTGDLCHGCPIVLWVIDERGAITEQTLWTPQITFDGGSQLSIQRTNAPVEAGGELEVVTEVTNPTDEQLTESLELVVGDEVVDTRSVTLDPHTTRSVTLGYETYPVATDVSFPVLARSESDRDSATVDVFAEVGPAELTILDANDPVLAGERLEVEAEVTNTHDSSITDTIHLLAGDRVDSTSVTLEPDESRVLTLGYDTYPVSSDVEFPIEVSGTGCRDRRPVRVYAEDLPSVRVDITGTNAPVAAGESLEVSARVANTGDAETTEDVSLVVGGERVDGTSVALSGGETTQVDLGYETYPVRQAVEFPVTVESDGVSDQQVVSVSPNSADEGENEDDTAGPVTVAIDGTNAPVEGGEQLTVQATLTNQGAAAATRTVELVAGGEVVDSRSVTVPVKGSQSVALGYSTYPVQQDVSFEVTVRTDNGSAATTVEVFGTDGESPDEDAGSVADEESGEGTATQSDDEGSTVSSAANDSEQSERVGKESQSAQNESASGNASNESS